MGSFLELFVMNWTHTVFLSNLSPSDIKMKNMLYSYFHVAHNLMGEIYFNKWLTYTMISVIFNTDTYMTREIWEKETGVSLGDCGCGCGDSLKRLHREYYFKVQLLLILQEDKGGKAFIRKERLQRHRDI